MSHPPMLRTCPFLTIAIALEPARVRDAVREPSKPSPGPAEGFTRR